MVSVMGEAPWNHMVELGRIMILEEKHGSCCFWEKGNVLLNKYLLCRQMDRESDIL